MVKKRIGSDGRLFYTVTTNLAKPARDFLEEEAAKHRRSLTTEIEICIRTRMMLVDDPRAYAEEYIYGMDYDRVDRAMLNPV